MARDPAKVKWLVSALGVDTKTIVEAFKGTGRGVRAPEDSEVHATGLDIEPLEDGVRGSGRGLRANDEDEPHATGLDLGPLEDGLRGSGRGLRAPDDGPHAMGLDIPGMPATGTVTGTQFSGRTPKGDEVQLVSGEGEIGEDGSVKGKGFVGRVKTGDEESELLTGEFQAGENGTSAKGAIARVKRRGMTDTLGEVEVSGQKAAVVGIKREVDVGEATGLLPDNAVVKADAAIGTASADGSVTDDGISVGAQANIAEGSVTLGTSGTKNDDGSDSDLDQSFRFGLSAGGGYAGRVHYGDADKDGNREYGVGADFGVVSFDVKTEDPLRTGIGLMNAAQGPTSIIPATFGPGGTTDEENLTKSVTGAVMEGLGLDETNVDGGLSAGYREAGAASSGPDELYHPERGGGAPSRPWAAAGAAGRERPSTVIPVDPPAPQRGGDVDGGLSPGFQEGPAAEVQVDGGVSPNFQDGPAQEVQRDGGLSPGFAEGPAAEVQVEGGVSPNFQDGPAQEVQRDGGRSPGFTEGPAADVQVEGGVSATVEDDD